MLRCSLSSSWFSYHAPAASLVDTAPSPTEPRPGSPGTSTVIGTTGSDFVEQHVSTPGVVQFVGPDGRWAYLSMQKFEALPANEKPRSATFNFLFHRIVNEFHKKRLTMHC